MFEREINSAEDFEDQIKQWAFYKGFGYFVIIASFPLIIIVSMIIDGFFSIWLFPAVFLLFGGLEILIHRKVMKSKFKFWMRIEVYEPLFNVFIMILIGGIIGSILLFFVLYLIFSDPVVSSWPRYFVGTLVLLLTIPVMYWVRRYRGKKFKGERIKYFHGNKPEIDELVKKALENMRLEYEVVEEGSKWSGLVPVYRIKGLDIDVKVRQFRIKEVMVATRINKQEDLPKAMEIERAIDSHLGIYTSKT
jgi:hypothetical protein